jgi:hypothetical protein
MQVLISVLVFNLIIFALVAVLAIALDRNTARRDHEQA